MRNFILNYINLTVSKSLKFFRMRKELVSMVQFILKLFSQFSHAKIEKLSQKE